MTSLADGRCTAWCLGSPVLTADELTAALPQLPEWEAADRDGVRALRKRFDFRSFAAGLVFANAVGQAADEQYHHPRIVVEYHWVEASWTLHVIHDLHRNDVVMAAKTDTLYLAR